MKDEHKDSDTNSRSRFSGRALHIVDGSAPTSRAGEPSAAFRSNVVGARPLRLWFEGEIGDCADYSLTSVLEAHEDELWHVVRDLRSRGIDTLQEINGRSVKEICGPDQSVSIGDVRKLIDALNSYCMEAYLSCERY